MAALIEHMGYEIDPILGLVYGRKSRKPIGADSRGYVKINHGRAGFYRMAHRMIWEACFGPIPEGMQINHLNGIKHDNRLENLELVTPGENLAHAYRTSLKCAKGELNGRAIEKRRRLAAQMATQSGASA